jgi:hypothetical protein
MLLTDRPTGGGRACYLEARMNLSAFTWYDLVGVLPGAPAEQIRREYDSVLSVGFELTGRLGLHLRAVRLTEKPMPVDGLIVGQQPQPPKQVRRDSELTVQVWHPPAHSFRAPRSMSNLPGT